VSGEAGAPRAEPSWRLLSAPVLGWLAFDLASTIFAFVVLTRYFNDWIVTERGQPDLVVGLMLATVSLTLLLVLPTLGATADRLGRHRPLLVPFTLASVAGTALLGVVDSVLAALAVAWVAIVAFQVAQSQYHPLLAAVAPPARRGLVSGLGIGIGFVGTLTALVVVGGLVGEGESQAAFLPAAGLYLAFALPCLLFVRDHPPDRARRSPDVPAESGAPWTRLAQSLRRAARHPYGRLLAARFLYVDALTTAIMFLTVYARRTGDFSTADVDLLFLFSTPFAIVGALGAGLASATGWVGPRRVLLSVLAATSMCLLAAGLSGAGDVLWVSGPILAIALGALSATDRAFLLALVPESRRGEGFGLYALIGNLSSGVGPLVLWGGTVYLLHDLLAVAGEFAASRVAVCVLALSALAGAGLVRGLPEATPGVVSSPG
jgi:UMF1 family MFS transporter